MIVRLNYFKFSGKWYSSGEYRTKEKDLWKIWEEVKTMRIDGDLPGLVLGANEFIVLIDVPDHLYNHPHLII